MHTNKLYTITIDISSQHSSYLSLRRLRNYQNKSLRLSKKGEYIDMPERVFGYIEDYPEGAICEFRQNLSQCDNYLGGLTVTFKSLKLSKKL